MPSELSVGHLQEQPGGLLFALKNISKSLKNLLLVLSFYSFLQGSIFPVLTTDPVTRTLALCLSLPS